MLLEVDDQLAPYLLIAVRRLARELARDGLCVPPGLGEFADGLVTGADERDGRDGQARRRRLAAARSARYRARRRQQAA